MKIFALLATAAVVASSVLSQAVAQHKPYEGKQTRAIKALSQEQIADLRAGRGMGLALAAELNGYPGPIHIIELSRELSLNADQRKQAEDLVTAMKEEAIPLGKQLVSLETDLDRLFASHTITESTLKFTTEQIGAVQASLRAAHLKYHLRALKLLTQEQMERYAELRGYKQVDDRHMHHQK